MYCDFDAILHYLRLRAAIALPRPMESSDKSKAIAAADALAFGVLNDIRRAELEPVLERVDLLADDADAVRTAVCLADDSTVLVGRLAEATLAVVMERLLVPLDTTRRVGAVVGLRVVLDTGWRIFV